jgi:hypothetical protein
MKLEKKAKGIIWISILSMFLICVLAFVIFTTAYANQYEYIKHYYAIKYNYEYYLFETYEDARNQLELLDLDNAEIVKIVLHEMDVPKYEVKNYEANN